MSLAFDHVMASLHYKSTSKSPRKLRLNKGHLKKTKDGFNTRTREGAVRHQRI